MASSTKYTDPALNLFKKTNVFYTNNKLLKYQDPTYLGFKLFFNFDQPTSGLLSTVPHPNTALGYLEAIGDKQRAAYLKTFVNLLQRINSECPWFWQSVSGLQEAWKRGYQDDQFKPGIPKDRKIEIITLDESIDLRMTALMDLYRKACFDWANRREVVPKNLRYFQVSVYCYEARTINRSGSPGNPPKATSVIDYARFTKQTTENQAMAKELLGDDPIAQGNINLPPSQTANSNPNDYKGDYINDNISRIMFDFTHCEWMPDESGVIVESLSHKEMVTKPQKLVFSYRNVNEVNLYRMFQFGDGGGVGKAVTDLFVSGLDALALDAPQAYTADNPPGFTLNGLENPLPGIMNPLWQQILSAKLTKDRILAQFMVDNPNDLGNSYNLLDPLENLPKIAKDAAKRALAEALRAASPVRQFLLGNVFGFSAAALAAAASSGVGGAAQAGLQEIGKNASKKNATLDSQSIDMGSQQYPSQTNTSGIPVNEQFGAGSPSLSNNLGIPTGIWGEDSISLTNRTVDVSGNLGNNQGITPNQSGTPSGNYSTNSISLNNSTVDGSNPLGVAGPPANNLTGIPSGNYSSESVSLSNGVDQDPTGNYKTGSNSLSNGADQDPSGNYGEGSISLGNAEPPAGTIDNVY